MNAYAWIASCLYQLARKWFLSSVTVAANTECLEEAGIILKILQAWIDSNLKQLLEVATSPSLIL